LVIQLVDTYLDSIISSNSDNDSDRIRCICDLLECCSQWLGISPSGYFTLWKPSRCNHHTNDHNHTNTNTTTTTTTTRVVQLSVKILEGLGSGEVVGLHHKHCHSELMRSAADVSLLILLLLLSPLLYLQLYISYHHYYH